MEGGIHKLHTVGKLQGLRLCNFQWNSLKLGVSISFLLWENCRGFPLQFSGELLKTGGIHKLIIMGKLQGLCPCNFQGNSWKLGASIIRVMGKWQA